MCIIISIQKKIYDIAIQFGNINFFLLNVCIIFLEIIKKKSPREIYRTKNLKLLSSKFTYWWLITFPLMSQWRLLRSHSFLCQILSNYTWWSFMAYIQVTRQSFNYGILSIYSSNITGSC